MLGFTGMWKLDICIEFDPLNTWLNERGVGFVDQTVSLLVLDIQRVIALLTNKIYVFLVRDSCVKKSVLYRYGLTSSRSAKPNVVYMYLCCLSFIMFYQ